MVVRMSRDLLQTVTLPILVDAEDFRNADGWGSRFSPNRYGFMAVQVVRPENVKSRLPKIFPGNHILLFAGADQLKRAYDTKDELALKQSLERVRPWIPELLGSKWPAPDLKSEVKWLGVRSVYSNLMSKALQSARLIMWCSDKEGRYLPGVYCPDWTTAAFATALMGQLRACPKCSKPFIPKAGNVDYCTPSHGVSYRTERSRWKAKQKAEERAKRQTRKVRKLSH